MKPTTIVALLLFAVPAFAQRLAPESTTLDGPAVIETTRCGGHFVVDAVINGEIPVTLIVDTGAGITILDSAIADRIAGDDAPSVTIEGGSGHQVQAQKLVPMKTLKIGPMVAHEHDALAIDLTPIRMGFNGRIDGILGYPTFRDVLLTLDFPNGELRVAPGTLDADDARELVEVPGDYRPYIELELVDGMTTPFLVDSGSNGVLDVPAGLPVDTTHEPVPSGATVTIGGADVTTAARLDAEYVFHGVRFDEPRFSFTMGEAKIGVEIMKHYAVTIDQRASLIAFVPGDNAPKLVRTVGVRSPGFAIAPVDGEIRVIKVFDDLHAVGLVEEGDVILSADDLDASAFGCDGLGDLIADRDNIDLRIRRADRELDVTVPIVELLP